MRQFAAESFVLQEVKSAAVDQEFTETTELLSLSCRQKPADTKASGSDQYWWGVGVITSCFTSAQLSSYVEEYL